jgi:hypothetical protein
MGYHMSLVGFKSIPEAPEPDTFKISQSDFYDNVIMYGTDCDMGPCRSPFHDAMFTSQDITFLHIYENNIPSTREDFRMVGCFTTKLSALSNFLMWAESKTNPFSHLAYFSEGVRVFVKAINDRAKNYKYLFWDSSTLYNNLDTLDDKKILRFLRQSCRFYDTVRAGRKASLESTKISIELTSFELKKDKVEYADWLDFDEDIKENAEKRQLYHFYGDV